MIVFEKLPHYPHGYDIPRNATDLSAGLDLRATEQLVLYPGEQAKVPTGLKLALPPGSFGLIVPRSSMGIKGLAVANTVGIIDADYRDEIFLFLWNSGLAKKEMYQNRIIVEEGERLAQVIVIRHSPYSFNVIEAPVGESNTDRAGGFGSTGDK